MENALVTQEANDISVKMLVSLQSVLQGHLRRKATNTNKKNDKFYSYIPYHYLNELIRQLIHVYALGGNDRLKFVDVGCGNGFIPLLAQQMGFDAYGIEYNEEYVDYAIEMFGFKKKSDWGHLTIQHANALRCNYKKYDVVYYFCPIANNELQSKLEARIEKTMKPGAFLIPKYKKGWRDSVPENFRVEYERPSNGGYKYDNCVFQKIT